MTNLGSEWHKLRVVLLIEVVQRLHVLRVGDEPVDGGEMLTLCKLLVKTPEHLKRKKDGQQSKTRDFS